MLPYQRGPCGKDLKPIAYSSQPARNRVPHLKAAEELNPAKNHVNKPVEDPDELCLASWPTESNNKCACFKPLHVWYFYTAINAGMPQFIVLRFTAPHRYRVLYKLNVCGNPALSKSNCASAHFMSLGHIFVILALFRTSHYICMVICDQRSSVL